MMGREAATLLLAAIDHPEAAPAQRLIKPLLVPRGSTGPAPQD
jgi:DNA-binding LacI/PurR family transcriptional regulator